MKNLIIIFLTAILLISCGDKNETTPVEEEKDKYAFDTTDLSTVSIDNVSESVLFRYKFEKGNKYKYRLTTISIDEQSIKTDTSFVQNVKQTVVYLLEFEPVQVDDDGTIELNCNITSVKLEASTNDQNFSYESGAEKDSAEIAKYSEYEAMVTNPFSVRIAPNGEILEIFRVDKIVNKYLEIKGYLDSLSTQEKTMVRGDLIDGVLKPLTVQVFRQMPAKNISRDTTWTVPQSPSRFMIYQITNINVYNIESFEELEGDTLVKLGAELDTKIEGNDKVTDRGVTYEFLKPVTSAEGTIYFNLTDGMIQKSRTGTSIEVSYTMEAQGPQGKQRGSRTEKIRNMNIIERL